MSKKTKTTVAEAAIEPIVANGIEFTPKMIEDLTKIATLESSVKGDKKAGLHSPTSRSATCRHP